MAEERLPHCSKCYLRVEEFLFIKLVPCKHLYCPKCLSSLTQCPIDNTPWDRSTLQESFTLLPAISKFLISQDPVAEELLYEDINVKLVKCRLTAKPGHDRSKCRYCHPSLAVESKPGPPQFQPGGLPFRQSELKPVLPQLYPMYPSQQPSLRPEIPQQLPSGFEPLLLFGHSQPVWPPQVSLAGTCINNPPDSYVLHRFSLIYSEQRESLVEALVFLCTEPVQLIGISIAAPLAQEQAVIIDFINLYKGVNASGVPVYTYTPTAQIKRESLFNAVIFLSEHYELQPFQKYVLTMKTSAHPDRSYQAYGGNFDSLQEARTGEDLSWWQFERYSQVHGTDDMVDSSSVLSFIYQR